MPASAAAMAGLLAQARAVGLSEDDIARVRQRSLTENVSFEHALRNAIRARAYGTPRTRAEAEAEYERAQRFVAGGRRKTMHEAHADLHDALRELGRAYLAVLIDVLVWMQSTYEAHRAPRVVLWGARRGIADVQLGSPLDRELCAFYDRSARMRRSVRVIVHTNSRLGLSMAEAVENTRRALEALNRSHARPRR